MTNFITSARQGKSLLSQSVANMHRERFASNHPLSYGWQYLRTNTKHWLPVYHQSGVELMRCPKGDGWLIKYLGERRRVRCHISEITAKLEQVKRAIENDLAKLFPTTGIWIRQDQE